MEFFYALSLKYIIPEIILVLSSMVFLVLDVFFPKVSENLQFFGKTTKMNLSSLLFIIVLIINTIIIFSFIGVNDQHVILNGHYLNNIFTVFMKLILNLFVIAFVLVFNNDFKQDRISANEFIILINLSVLGMYLTISSVDFLLLYVAIELQTLCFYIMTAYRTKSILSTEAGLKYFILGSVSSAIMLFGMSLLYGFTGTNSFQELNSYLIFNSADISQNGSIIVGIIFIISGILFKLGAAPFHFWLPDVYEGSKFIVTAYFSIITKISILVMFINLLRISFDSYFMYWHYFLLVSGLFSLVIGTIGALYQINLKRFIAYSGISHMGFMLLALSIGNDLAIIACVYYLLIYLILSLNFFSALICFRTIKNLSIIKSISDLRDLPLTDTFVATCFSINIFSFAGIPPLAGFYGKYLVIKTLFAADMILIGSSSMLISVIGALYYVKLIHIMYFQKLESVESKLILDISIYNKIILSVTTFLNLFFWFFSREILCLLQYIFDSIDIISIII